MKLEITKLPKEIVEKAERLGNILDDIAELKTAVEKIEEIVSDDFSFDVSCDLANKKFNTEIEKTMAEKLMKIYRIAHSNNKSNSCYNSHEDWRKE